jgi:hypothetical protein
MIRLLVSTLILLAIVAAWRFRRDTQVWLPYPDDDWLSEVDPRLVARDGR